MFETIITCLIIGLGMAFWLALTIVTLMGDEQSGRERIY